VVNADFNEKINFQKNFLWSGEGAGLIGLIWQIGVERDDDGEKVRGPKGPRWVRLSCTPGCGA
jgi:hypothetical protein